VSQPPGLFVQQLSVCILYNSISAALQVETGNLKISPAARARGAGCIPHFVESPAVRGQRREVLPDRPPDGGKLGIMGSLGGQLAIGKGQPGYPFVGARHSLRPDSAGLEPARTASETAAGKHKHNSPKARRNLFARRRLRRREKRLLARSPLSAGSRLQQYHPLPSPQGGHRSTKRGMHPGHLGTGHPACARVRILIVGGKSAAKSACAILLHRPTGRCGHCCQRRQCPCSPIAHGDTGWPAARRQRVGGKPSAAGDPREPAGRVEKMGRMGILRQIGGLGRLVRLCRPR